MTNVLLQLVRDIINGVCYQRYEKRLVQQGGNISKCNIGCVQQPEGQT